MAVVDERPKSPSIAERARTRTYPFVSSNLTDCHQMNNCMIYIFLFYNKAEGKQSRLAFSEDFKHCDLISYDGDIFLRIGWNKQGITFNRRRTRNLTHLVRKLRLIPELSGILVTDNSGRVEVPWRPFIVRSCNEMARYVSGIDIGFTWNPAHFFNKVLRCSGKRNFTVLYAWRRKDNGLSRRQ